LELFRQCGTFYFILELFRQCGIFAWFLNYLCFSFYCYFPYSLLYIEGDIRIFQMNWRYRISID
jgi:hypothetical protein